MDRTVTFHPTQVNVPRSTPARKTGLVLDLPTPKGWKAEWPRWLVTCTQVCPHVSNLYFASIPFPSSPNWRGVQTLRPVHCNAHYGPTITQSFHRYDAFENRRFERLLKPVKAAIVYLQCIFRDSHCCFSSMRLKSGGGYGTPHSKNWGYAYPPYPPKVTPMMPLFPYPTPIRAKILGCSLRSRSVMLGSSERRKVTLISREIISEEFQRIWSQSTNVTDGRTDRQTTYHGNTALRYASLGKNCSHRPRTYNLGPEMDGSTCRNYRNISAVPIISSRMKFALPGGLICQTWIMLQLTTTSKHYAVTDYVVRSVRILRETKEETTWRKGRF